MAGELGEVEQAPNPQGSRTISGKKPSSNPPGQGQTEMEEYSSCEESIRDSQKISVDKMQGNCEPEAKPTGLERRHSHDGMLGNYGSQHGQPRGQAQPIVDHNRQYWENRRNTNATMPAHHGRRTATAPMDGRTYGPEPPPPSSSKQTPITWEQGYYILWQEYNVMAQSKEQYRANTIELKKKLSVVQQDFERLRLQFNEIQGEKLEALDQFQPVTHPILLAEVNRLKTTITRISRYVTANKNKETTSGDLAKLFNNCTLTPNLWDEIWNSNNHHKYLIESVIWQEIVMKLFKHPFQAFNRQRGEQLLSTWEGIFGSGIPGGPPPGDEVREKWRSITVAYLCTTNITEELQQVSIDISDEIADLLCSRVVNTEAVPKIQQEIYKAVQIAQGLALTFAKERCVLTFFTQPKNEQEIGHLQIEEANNGKLVRFIGRPGVRAWGNGYGQRLSESKLLKRAEVWWDLDEHED